MDGWRHELINGWIMDGEVNRWMGERKDGDMN